MIAETRVVLKAEKNDRTYEFHMPVGVQYGEVYDAAFQILDDIVVLMQQAKESVKPKTAEAEETTTD